MPRPGVLTFELVEVDGESGEARCEGFCGVWRGGHEEGVD